MNQIAIFAIGVIFGTALAFFMFELKANADERRARRFFGAQADIVAKALTEVRESIAARPGPDGQGKEGLN
jgi:hypothetical protein